MDLWTGLLCLLVIVLSSIIYLIPFSSVKENSFEEIKASRRKLLQRYKDETRLNNEKAKEKKSKKAKKAKEKLGDGDKQKTGGNTFKEPDSQSDDEKENMQAQIEHDTNQLLDDEDSKHVKKGIVVKQDLLGPDTSKAAKNISEESELDHIAGESIIAKKEVKKAKMAVNVQSNKNDGNKRQGKVEKDNLIDKMMCQPTIDETIFKETSQAISKSNNVLKQPVTLNSKASRLPNILEDERQNKKMLEETSSKEHGHQNIKENPIKPIFQNSSTKSGKKKKTDVTSLQQLSNDKEAVNINLLMPILQKAELSRSEIQLLIDALLNKQQDESSEWLRGRQDPLVKLKKQLAEKEKALIEEQQASNGLQTKLKELRAELNAEKANVRQKLEECIASKQNECKALTLKYQQATDDYQALISKCQDLQKKLDEEHQLIKKFEEDKVLHQDMQITHVQHCEALQVHINQLTAQVQEHQGLYSTLEEENTLLQERFRIQEDDFSCHISNCQFEIERLQGQVADSNAEIEKLSEYINEMERKNEILVHDQLVEQVPASREESLLDSSMEGRENGDLYPNKEEHATNLQAIIEEKEALVDQLNLQLDQKENLIEHLNNELIFCKNDANRKQNMLDSANIEISKLISETSILSKKFTEKVATINEIQNELTSKMEEVIMLRKDIEAHKQRNNELRNKNWKVVEALATAELALQKSTPHAKNTPDSDEKMKDHFQLKLQLTQLFHRIFPDLSLEDCHDLELWLTKVEQAALESKQAQSTSPHIISELEAQNSQLHTMITHYKAIINDTEGMLNSLQAHIEVEETRWGDRIQALQEELETLKGNKQKRIRTDSRRATSRE